MFRIHDLALVKADTKLLGVRLVFFVSKDAVYVFRLLKFCANIGFFASRERYFDERARGGLPEITATKSKF